MSEPKNIQKPVVELYHSRLVRVGDSIYRSECPFCIDGILPVQRDEASGVLLSLDRCVSCGQAVKYLDEPFKRKQITL